MAATPGRVCFFQPKGLSRWRPVGAPVQSPRRGMSRCCGKIVKRIPEQAAGIPVPADRRLFPLKRLTAEIRRDQPVAAEALMYVMLCKDDAAEILEHRMATLMGQRI